MLYDCANEITSNTVVFHDALTTNLAVPGATFREVTEEDKERIFEHKVEGVGDWLIEDKGSIVATGGIALHYNLPYGDLYMEVDEPFRRRGYGSYLIQELKRPATRWAGYPRPLQRRECGVPGDTAEIGPLPMCQDPQRRPPGRLTCDR